MGEPSAAERKWASVFLLVVGTGGTAFNWWYLENHDRYYPKFAVICPLAAILGGFILCFPRYFGKAAPGEGSKTAVQIAVGVVAAGVGFLNLWLMSRG